MRLVNKALLASDSIPKTPLAAEVERRRTFAIISHPDAGKTTLTEKLLLFGGAINLAGQVKAKRDRRSTRSDWMAIERERGISVVTSVMTFDYDGRVFNLLDTPGHEDFSEDTYRTLSAAAHSRLTRCHDSPHGCSPSREGSPRPLSATRYAVPSRGSAQASHDPVGWVCATTDGSHTVRASSR